MKSKFNLKTVEELLCYRLIDQSLFVQALTHRSASNQNNERLEYLGDAVLDLVVAEDLYLRFPEADEGELSRMRASLVNGDTLAKLAREVDLAEHLILGSGEMKSGGHRRSSILAGTIEALIGAIYLDGGFNASQAFIRHLYLREYEVLSLDDALKDPKTRLQEYSQSRSLPLPGYVVMSIVGEGHQQVFTVECAIDTLSKGAVSGEGRSRRKAEQSSAAAMLVRLGVD
ncbi:MAG: ribonuclease III [Gammaproteobacteria bacterium]|nr:ribonuclease III [Gammaproteobacteria bacterium]